MINDITEIECPTSGHVIIPPNKTAIENFLRKKSDVTLVAIHFMLANWSDDLEESIGMKEQEVEEMFDSDFSKR